MNKRRITLVLITGLALFLGACPSNLSRQNPLEPSPQKPGPPSGPGVFENFESGSVATVWSGGAGAPDSIVLQNSVEDAYTGTHSLKYTVSVNDPATYPSLWGSVGHDVNSTFGVVDATGASQLSFRYRSSAPFQVFILLFENGSGGTSCAEGGTSEAWKWAPLNLPASTTWAEATLPLSGLIPHIKNACVSQNATLDKNLIKTLEINFQTTTYPLSAVVYIDDILFKP